MKKLQQYVLAAALASALTPTGVAWALDVPRSYKADSRVRYATYNAENVIQIDAVLGVATMIELEPGEEYVYHVYGDSKAYSFTTKNNYLFFKPIAEQANSNLLVLTNRRSYQFKINYYEDPAKALYKLTLRYPESEAAATAAEAERKELAHGLSEQVPINWQSYTMSGDRAIAPIHAWDDGRQTWLQFAPGTDLPTVYRVTADGQETVANFRMAGARTMVLHQTGARWHLRSGKLVLALYNEANGTGVQPLQTGTISPRIERVVIGASPAAPRFEDRPLEQIPASAPVTPDAPGNPPAQPMPVQRAADITLAREAPKADGTANMQGLTSKAGPAASASPALDKPNNGISASSSVPSTTESVPPSPSTAAASAVQPPEAADTAHVEVGPYVAGAGDPALLPKKVWITGDVTRMQFASGNMPAVFAQDTHGADQFVGLDIEPGNVLAIHATSSQWRLVSGQASITLSKKEP